MAGDGRWERGGRRSSPSGAGAPRQATGSGIDPLELPVTITVTVGNESVRPQGKDFSA